MDTPAATILVVTDITTDATLVKNLLTPEFDQVFISTDPDKLASDFVRHLPSVLVLAFNSLEKSERYYLGLYRQCHEVHQHPHRTVILCNKDEMTRAYELCKKGYFDDYVLFWPMVHDTLRLPMTILHALRELAALKADGPSVAKFAAQARQLEELEKTLDQQIAQGGLHIEEASQAMEQTGQKINMAQDGLSQTLVSGVLPGSGAVTQVNAIENEVDRFNHEEVRRESASRLESAHALNATAESTRPAVLVVDDDEFQHKIIAKLLEAENYRLFFAGDGFEALNILHKIQPDLILMDVMMPHMDGIATTRRLKTLPQFANVPVIMITGKSKGKVVVDSLKAGAVDFVVKPFDRATLIAKMVHALSATPSKA